MFSKFFIERPVLANVIAIIMMLLGAVALLKLPVAQYPEITPPTVQVTTAYPGASPEVIAETVAAPLEQQINGVENMLYMSSKSTSDGTYTLTVTFEVGTDLDIATVLVQNRANIAVPRLPQDVQTMLIEEAAKMGDHLTELTLAANDDLIRRFEAANIQVVRDIDIPAMARATQSVYSAIPGWSPGLYERVRAILAAS